MVTTTYKCDRCGKEAVNDPNFLQRLVIGIYRNYSGNFQPKLGEGLERQWCKDCCREVGIYREDQAVRTTVTPTFEDILSEFIGERVAEELACRG